MTNKKKLISLIVPAYNEFEGIGMFFAALTAELPDHYTYELIFIDDGSTDNTVDVIKQLSKNDARVKLLSLSRNFGKEAATSAGICYAKGEALLMLDADGQHPVNAIPEFLQKWEAGADVVIGVRDAYATEGILKKLYSKAFYSIFNRATEHKLIPGSTDFRLIDKAVQAEFVQLEEKNRMTRALIDWLGFEREYIHFRAKQRIAGEASYTTKKLVGLAINSFISLTLLPLYISGYLGLIITPSAFLLGVFIFIEHYLLNDPLMLNISGSAMLGVMILFLVGIILIGQGLCAIYISRIYDETKRRPVFIVNKRRSVL